MSQQTQMPPSVRKSLKSLVGFGIFMLVIFIMSECDSGIPSNVTSALSATDTHKLLRQLKAECKELDHYWRDVNSVEINDLKADDASYLYEHRAHGWNRILEVRVRIVDHPFMPDEYRAARNTLYYFFGGGREPGISFGTKHPERVVCGEEFATGRVFRSRSDYAWIESGPAKTAYTEHFANVGQPIVWSEPAQTEDGYGVDGESEDGKHDLRLVGPDGNPTVVRVMSDYRPESKAMAANMIARGVSYALGNNEQEAWVKETLPQISVEGIVTQTFGDWTITLSRDSEVMVSLMAKKSLE